MWEIVQVDSSYRLWFSDGKAIEAPRGGSDDSSRLIVDRLGFLDVTEILFPEPLLDANGSLLCVQPPTPGPYGQKNTTASCMRLSLKIKDGGFTLTWIQFGTASVAPMPRVSGRLKPLPSVSAADADFIDCMIEKKYVPYQNSPDAPGKPVEEIRALGKQLFPFTPYSFQLAMCVYDWTTASFARMVFLKIFEYTGIPPPPFPTDQSSIATAIWTSNWGSYTPQNKDYMHSFMMQPANSLDDVKAQLSNVATALHNFSSVENRLLSAAMKALPRTSIFQHSQLFSGQVDIYQLGLDRFGIEFLECPANTGPVGKELIIPFAETLATYVSAGKTITTKMVWSFTDSVEDAMHYSNGILLVANIPRGSVVWESAAYVTLLSNDPKKTEYTFMPGTQFQVQSVDKTTFDGKPIVVIALQPTVPDEENLTTPELPSEAKETIPSGIGRSEVLSRVEAYTPAVGLPHAAEKNGGRRCACVVGG